MTEYSVKNKADSMRRIAEPSKQLAPTSQILPPKFRELYRHIQDLKVYDDDVWLVSFPESGTHWMRETLCSLLHGMNFNKLRSKDYKRSLNIELGCFDTSGNQPQLKLSNLSNYHETLERPRIMTTHLCWQNLPKAVRDPNCKAKIVYLTRHPRDVCVSLYYQHLTAHGERFKETAKSLEDFAEDFISGKIIFGPYWSHLFEYWVRRNHPKIICILYEEMETDFSKVLSRLHKFLNLGPLTADQKQELIKYLEIQKLKEKPADQKQELIKYLEFQKLKEKPGSASHAFWQKANADVKEGVGSIQQEKVDSRISYITEQITPEILGKFDIFIFANSDMGGYEDFEEIGFCKL